MEKKWRASDPRFQEKKQPVIIPNYFRKSVGPSCQEAIYLKGFFPQDLFAAITNLLNIPTMESFPIVTLKKYQLLFPTKNNKIPSKQKIKIYLRAHSSYQQGLGDHVTPESTAIELVTI